MGGKPRKPPTERAERIFLCKAGGDIYGHWGIGKTMIEAEANLVKNHGKIGKRGENSVCYLLPEGAERPYIDHKGDIIWFWDEAAQKLPADRRPTAIRIY